FDVWRGRPPQPLLKGGGVLLGPPVEWDGIPPDDVLHPVRDRGQPAFAHRAPDVDERVRVRAFTGPAHHASKCLLVGELLEADALANGAADGRSHLAIAQRLRTGDDQGLATVVTRGQGRDGDIGNVVWVDERDLALPWRGPQHALLADRVRPTKRIRHEAGRLDERERHPALANGSLAARVPRSRSHAGVHVQRGEFDHMPDLSGFRSERDRAILLIEIRAIAHEEDPLDT